MSYNNELLHRDRKLAKIEKIQGLKSLIETWEAKVEPDHPYIRDLKKRLKTVELQFQAMKP